MTPRHVARAHVTAVLGLAVAAAAVVLLGVGSRTAFGADPCAGYDICFQLQAASVDGSDGSGWLTSSLGGLDCHYVAGQVDQSTRCNTYVRANFVSSVNVTITGTADPGNLVWCGNVGGPVPACSYQTGPLSLDSVGSIVPVGAQFTIEWGTVAVGNDGLGGGTVRSLSGSIDCGTSGGPCSTRVQFTMDISLSAIPDAGWSFTGWTGQCLGHGSTCAFTVNAPSYSTTAHFAPAPASPTPAPTPTRSPTPSGPGPTRTPSSSLAPGGTHLSSAAPSSSLSPAASADSGSAASPGPRDSPTDQPAVPGSVVDGGAAGPGAPGAIGPVGSQGPATDLTPIVLAILGAGGLLALAILGGAAMTRSRRRDGPPA